MSTWVPKVLDLFAFPLIWLYICIYIYTHTNYFRDRHSSQDFNKKNRVITKRFHLMLQTLDRNPASGENEDLQCTYPSRNIRVPSLSTELLIGNPWSLFLRLLLSCWYFQLWRFPAIKLFMPGFLIIWPAIWGFQFAWLYLNQHSLVGSQTKFLFTRS